MAADYEIDIFELWRIIARRRWLVLASVLLFSAGAGLATLLAPTIYRCQSTIALPGEPYQWMKIAEVKEVVAAARSRAVRGMPLGDLPPGDLAKVSDIRVMEMPESQTFFKLVVKAKGDQEAAVRVSQGIYRYLTTDPSIQARLQIMVRGADSVLAFAERTLQSALKSRGGQGGDPELVALYDKVYEFRIRRASLRNFEYISPPLLDPAPASPRPVLNLAISVLVGLMAGILLAVFADRRSAKDV